MCPRAHCVQEPHEVESPSAFLGSPPLTISSIFVNIPGEGVYRQCGLCHMQISPLASGHEQIVNIAGKDMRRSSNMRPPWTPLEPWRSHSEPTGLSLTGWRCLNTWGDCWHSTTVIPRLCEATFKRYGHISRTLQLHSLLNIRCSLVLK